MAHTVHCVKYQKDLEGLDLPPYPGEKGQYIFNNVSKQAWQDWLQHQTMLINEKRLNMMDPKAREYLKGELDKFLNNQDYDQADGYVAPSE